MKKKRRSECFNQMKGKMFTGFGSTLTFVAAVATVGVSIATASNVNARAVVARPFVNRIAC